MKFRYIILLLVLIPLLAVPVFAHPGKTDSSGGHTDHETGSYHYHHGYPAHQHCDKNGDGKQDCPYEFIDKTDHSTDNSSKSGNSDNISPKNGFSDSFNEAVRKALAKQQSNNLSVDSRQETGKNDLPDILRNVLLLTTLGFFGFLFFTYKKR